MNHVMLITSLKATISDLQKLVATYEAWVQQESSKATPDDLISSIITELKGTEKPTVDPVVAGIIAELKAKENADNKAVAPTPTNFDFVDHGRDECASCSNTLVPDTRMCKHRAKPNEYTRGPNKGMCAEYQPRVIL